MCTLISSSLLESSRHSPSPTPPTPLAPSSHLSRHIPLPPHILPHLSLTANETRGALKTFMSQTNAQPEGESLWAKLRREAAPPADGPARVWSPKESPLGPGREGATPGPRRAPTPFKSLNPRSAPMGKSAGKRPAGAGAAEGAEGDNDFMCDNVHYCGIISVFLVCLPNILSNILPVI